MDILNKSITRTNGLVGRIIDNEAFLMSENGKKVHMINKVGTLIWDCADGCISIEDIIDRILMRFDIDEVTARNDCLAFINELSDMKLLTITEKV